MPIVRITNKARDSSVIADVVIPSGKSAIVDWPASKLEQHGTTLQTLQDLGLIQYTVSYNASVDEDVEIAMLSFATGGGGGGVPTSRLINTIAPLGGGGDLSADRTLTISLATPSDPGSMSAADKLKLDSFPVSAVPTSRILLAGAGLTGGGDLTANRMFDIGANPDGSITVNADNIQVGILATDAQHGTRGGGTLHADATTSVAGFMSAADKTKLDAFPSSAVPDTRNLAAGAGLTGGGNLTADRTFNVVANADGSIVVNPDDIQVGVISDTQHGTRGGGTQHAVATGAANGFMSLADKNKLDGLPATAVPDTRILTAGAGLTGGGDLTADRTFNVAANADGSITVNANDIQVGILATDAQHGTRGGGTQHADATGAVAGFMSAADKTKLDALPTTAVPDTRTLTAGAGLTGGGDLSANRTFDIVAADSTITVNANSIQVGVIADANHGNLSGGALHADATGAVAGFMSATDKSKLNGLPSSAPPTTLTLTAGAGLTGGGDLSANRTFNVVANADGSITVNADDIQVGVLASDAQHGNRGGGGIHAIATGAVAGFLSAADKTKLDALPSTAPPTTLTLTAGAGLTGGGDLSANRTFDIVAGDGSITVNANDIHVGVISDTQHGTRGGGTQHADATILVAGFMSAADKVKLDGFPASAVPDTRTLTAGAGLTGGGNLTADRTFDVVANADGSIVANANDIQVGILATDAQHGNRGGGGIHAAATGAVAGFMSAADKTKLDALPSTAPPTTLTLTAGAGLTGGGDLSANRTFDVVANADGSITVNANDIQVGILATDAQHGTRGGATLHAVATGSANGFMSLSDKNKLDALPSTAPPTTLTLTAGAGLTGGGDLSANRTFNVVANADGSITVNADDIQVGILATDAQHGTRGGGTLHADATGAVAGFMSAADKTKLDGLPSAAVPDSRTLTAGAGLTGGGDLSANRTFNVVANADGSITVNADDIQVGILATDAQHGTRGSGTLHATATSGTQGFIALATQLEVNAGIVTDKAVTPATLAPLLAAPHYGFADVDFGAAPYGSAYTTTVITGEGAILAGSSVRAWLYPKDTVNHTLDEHIIDGPIVAAGNIDPGTGFTIYAVSGPTQGNMFGLWSVAWAYNV